MNPLRIQYREVEALIPYVRNPRTHTADQVAKLAANIVEYGWTNPILVDGNQGMIAGHGRLLAARQLGLTEVPVIELGSLSATQRRAYLLSDNRLALDAGWDETLLALELDELSEEGYDLSLAGFEVTEIEEILGTDVALGPDDEPDTAADPAVISALVQGDREVLPYWDGWLSWMRNEGWRRFGWYVWDQGAGMPGDWNGRLSPAFEYEIAAERLGVAA